jgi:3-hydroxyacyl-[acyl-carrier-protein] dehydratase
MLPPRRVAGAPIVRFVLIDRFLELEPGVRAVALKTFDPGEEVFRDHFPGLAIVPGVLLTEAMGQAGGWLLAATLGFSRWPLLAMIDRAKFRRLVRPGEEIRLEAVVRSSRDTDYEIAGEASVGGERVAQARLLFHAFDFPLPDDERAQFGAWARETFRRLAADLSIQP